MDWVSRTAYPFRSRYREVRGGRMHYVDEGRGEPIVLVHGVPTWSYSFRHLIRRFAATHRCIALDHLGFGLSDKPLEGPYDPAALAANLGDLIGELGLRNITLVVHDWGGPIGLAYALQHPKDVARLVLFNTWMWPAEGDLRARSIARFLASPLYLALERRFAITARLFTRLAIARREAVSSETLRHYSEPFRRRTDRAGLVSLVRSIHTADPWLGTLWDKRHSLSQLPTLIFWGMRDPAFPARYLRRWETVFEAPEVHRLTGVGHYPHEEAPEVVMSVIERFLARPLC